MSNLILIFILKNIFIISILFWFLNFIGSYFYDNLKNTNKNIIYECGFKSINNINFNININIFIIALFFLLYDLEFIFLIPTIFNIFNVNTLNLILLFILIAILVLTFYIDWFYNLCNWNL